MDQKRIDEFEEFVAQFTAETDRAAVILGAAKLDFLLYQITVHSLVPNYSKQDDLFDGDGPLSSFSARISICYRLGKIDAGFAKALHLIRKTRNEFAHQVPESKLNAPPHRDRIRELVGLISDKETLDGIKRTFFAAKEGHAADFFAIVALLVARLEALYAKCEAITGANAHGILPRKGQVTRFAAPKKSKIQMKK